MTDDLLSLSFINEHYLRYDSLRGCKNWLQVKGLLIIKLGKNYFVKENEFNQVINKMKNRNTVFARTKVKSAKNVMSGYEDIYLDLLNSIKTL